MNPTPTDTAHLDAAIQQARAAAPAPEGLWPVLLQRLTQPPNWVREQLRQLHGIEVWDGAQLRHQLQAPGLQVLSTHDDSVVLAAGAQRWLLADDPWAATVLQRWAQSAQSPLQLVWVVGEPWRALLSATAAPPDLLPGAAELPGFALDARAPAPLSAAVDVVAFVDAAIAQAYRDGASDIHFETRRDGLQVKYRLDGVMVAGQELAHGAVAEQVVSRIKVMAQLDITERRRPQDGRIRWQGLARGGLDLRVSVMPSIFGEDVVLRLLDKAQLREGSGAITLDGLGFDTVLAGPLRALAARPHGMLLVTGPTGSGKTTTVYAALSEVNNGLEKIITIEDPVEYELPGVLQIPVNEQKGLTFATGLRSILRHDPDKILVGEIRDAETAEIAVQSSLTGHLVFTTVHANSLFDVLGRFQHFAIEPFALASALNGVVVQRLLRRLCPHCAATRALTPAEHTRLAAFPALAADGVPVACGCAQCRGTGYKGRFVVAEVHELTDTLRDLIVRRATLLELKTALHAQQAQQLLPQALHRVQQRWTTLEEVNRVIGGV